MATTLFLAGFDPERSYAIARAVERATGDLDVAAPRIPLFDHRDGAQLETAEAVRERLSGQLTSRLDWSAAIGRLFSEGVSVFVEMPPGSSTTRMVRWIARDATAFALDQADDRERFLARAGPPGGVS